MHQHAVATVPEPLTPYISALYGYRVEGLPVGTHVGMPSRTVTLVIPLDEPLTMTVPGRGVLTQWTVLAGLHDQPVQVHHQGHQFGIQAALTPRAVRGLFGAPPSELAGQVIGLDDLIGQPGRDLPERLAAAGTWTERFELLTAVMGRRLELGESEVLARPEVAEAWRVLARFHGSVPVSRVAEHVGWSARHLTGRFHREYGLRPKAAARVMRFERSTQLVRTGGRLAEVAAACGYADQAHLTREWRALAGLTPGRWQRDDVLANVQDRVDGPVAGSPV